MNANKQMWRMPFLSERNGQPNRWKEEKQGELLFDPQKKKKKTSKNNNNN